MVITYSPPFPFWSTIVILSGGPRDPLSVLGYLARYLYVIFYFSFFYSENAKNIYPTLSFNRLVQLARIDTLVRIVGDTSKVLFVLKGTVAGYQYLHGLIP